jgi:hypothetical protein
VTWEEEAFHSCRGVAAAVVALQSRPTRAEDRRLFAKAFILFSACRTPVGLLEGVDECTRVRMHKNKKSPLDRMLFLFTVTAVCRVSTTFFLFRTFASVLLFSSATFASIPSYVLYTTTVLASSVAAGGDSPSEVYS